MEWTLGDTKVEELYESKNLGVFLRRNSFFDVITSAHFPQMLTIISIRPGKYWHDIFIKFRSSESHLCHWNWIRRYFRSLIFDLM